MTRRPKDPLLGTILSGRFRLESLLGRGGYGAVYKAAQLQAMDRAVAVKVLELPKLISPEDQDLLIGRFHREGEVMVRLNHPNTVTMIGFGEDEETGLLWLALELLKGEGGGRNNTKTAR